MRGSDEDRKKLISVALERWEPEYPGQAKPKLVVWFADEPEDGLSGFHTEEDRDRFRAGDLGPFLRRVTGREYQQLPIRVARET